MLVAYRTTFIKIISGLEIVYELKKRSDCPDEVKKFTSENIAIVNRTRRMAVTSRKRSGHFMALFKKH